MSDSDYGSAVAWGRGFAPGTFTHDLYLAYEREKSRRGQAEEKLALHSPFCVKPEAHSIACERAENAEEKLRIAREALEELSKGNRSPGVLAVAKEALAKIGEETKCTNG